MVVQTAIVATVKKETTRSFTIDTASHGDCGVRVMSLGTSMGLVKNEGWDWVYAKLWRGMTHEKCTCTIKTEHSFCGYSLLCARLSKLCTCLFDSQMLLLQCVCMKGVKYTVMPVCQSVSQSACSLSARLSIKTNRNSSNIYFNDSRTAMCTYKSQ